MNHFYGGIQGQAGDATRMGSKNSGYRAYAQSHYSRIEINLRHLGGSVTGKGRGIGLDDKDIAHVSIGGGYGTHYRDRTLSFNPNTVAKALDSGDPRIERIWARIDKAFRELDDQAPLAIERSEKRKEREQRKREKEDAERRKMQAEAIATMKPEEKARAVKLLRWVELDSTGDFDFESDSLHYLCSINEGNLRRHENGHLMIDAPLKGGRSHTRFDFDLTAGVWLFEFDPIDDLGITPEDMHDMGWRTLRTGVA